jgi:1,4-dihydroxy-2-naphthoyl-CoA hydrolase
MADDMVRFLNERGLGALAVKMGIEVLEFTTERAVARMPVDGNTQPFGLMHGGAYVVLAESLGSTHANFLAGPDKLAVGIEVNASHTGSVSEGWVTGTCLPLEIGELTIIHEIVVADENGRRCSTIRITDFVRDAPGSGFFQ